MTQLETKIEITYRWWEAGKELIDPRHKVMLDVRANHFLADQIKLGFTSGEMPTERIRDKMYTGYWEIKSVTKAR